MCLILGASLGAERINGGSLNIKKAWVSRIKTNNNKKVPGARDADVSSPCIVKGGEGASDAGRGPADGVVGNEGGR
jgi:hypothetical protein